MALFRIVGLLSLLFFGFEFAFFFMGLSLPFFGFEFPFFCHGTQFALMGFFFFCGTQFAFLSCYNLK